MKKLLFIFILLFSSFSSHSQEMSTMGKDFWFSFAEGRIEAAMSVTITGTRACTGVVTNPNTGWSQTFNVPANGSTVLSIDTATSYNTASGIVKNKGLHLTTTDTVSVYASNFLTTSFDASFVLPTESLRDEYMIQTYKTKTADRPSEILIVAIEDSTVVDIFPTAGTVNISNGTNSFSRVLNAGQTLQLQSVANGDYSGTRVKSHDCKPIAVFNAHLCAYVPDNTGSSCDHLFEQCLPIVYWGTEFVATMSNHHNGDIIKVTALEDNCKVWKDGTLQTTLAAGQSYSFSMTYSPSCFIRTSSPATVYSYLMSKNVAGPDGDPSMILLPPIEQQLKDVVFVNYSFSGQLSNYHCLNIVTRTDNVNNMMMDNNSISNQFSTVSGNTTYSYARMNVNAGSHHLYSTGSTGFVAHAYGVGSNESYGYAVGFSVKPINNRLIVNGNEVSYSDTVKMCIYDTLEAFVSGADSIAGWYLDDSFISESTILKQVISGPDTVRLTVLLDGSQSCFATPDTLSCVLLVKKSPTFEFDSATCDNPFNWNGLTCDSSGVYNKTFSVSGECDSMVTMHLTILDEQSSYIQMSGCDSLIVNGLPYYGNDTVLYETIVAHNGCDSNVYAIINILHGKEIVVEQNIEEGDTIVWLDGGYYYDDSVSPTVVYTAANGCDSIIHLHIHVIPAPEPPDIDSSALWIPTSFTPEAESNQIFKIFGNDILEMKVTIFTRWGLFLTEFDGLNGGWDGTYHGLMCKQETYVYIVEYRTNVMPKIVQRRIGTVTLLR